MSKRRRSALTTLALAVAALFALPASPASAGTATTPNACANSVTANFSQIGVTTSGDDGVNFASPGQALSESASQSAAIPGAIFVAGYNLGLLVQGVNNVPANVRSTIEATNTVEGSQNTNVVGGSPPNGTVSVTTTITDPDGTPGTGDETATDASFSVTYNNLNWTAGAGGTIDYRQQSIAVAPPTAANNTLLINALVGGIFNVQFRCAPGTVTPPDPGIITLIDPAGSFDTTTIDAFAPVTNAGPDQTVSPGALVTLDGSASTDQDLPNDTLTYSWTQTGGPAVTLSDPTAVMPTFTAPSPGSATLTFQLMVTDQAGKSTTDSVTINVVNLAPTANAGPDQTVAAGSLVTLDGTASSDPEGQALTYQWSQTSGPAVTLSDPTAAMPTFTAPSPGPATLTFDLTVCDPEPLCDATPDSVTIIVPPPTVTNISISDASATEGGAETFTVSLDSASSATITVDFATADGTALAGSDYTSNSGTLTFAPGETSHTVTVQTIDDTVCEPTETFNVNLSNATGDNATILDGLGVGTITDNDQCVDKAGQVIVNGPVKAGATTKVYVFKVSNLGTSTNTVDCASEIAIAADTFVSVNGTANGQVSCITASKTIGPGSSARFRLRWTGDPLPAGATVVFNACVREAGDIDTSNDCGSVTRTT